MCALQRACCVLVSGLSLVLLVGHANGDIITGGAIVLVPPPSSVLPHVTESNTDILLFNERESLTLTEDLIVDMTDPGTVTHWYETPGGTVPSGTSVDVYLLHYDTVGETIDNFLTLAGSATFDRRILGVILYEDRLDATDAILGCPTTLYPTGQRFRGSGEWRDSITIEPDRKTVSVSISTDTHVDHIRVITVPRASIPEPSTLAGLFIVGILALVRHLCSRFAA